MKDIKLSALDLAIVPQGGNTLTAIERTVKLAQHIEQAGYERLWLAEHHNMPNIASSATSVLIGHVAGKTKTLRIGSGGIMLPNHSPLQIAEQFGTLEALYPNRIDLGLGRAPGTDQITAYALRKNNMRYEYDFAANIAELQQFFYNTDEYAKVRAFPGEGANVPIWILGSSTDSAYLAAELGLPYAFAAHFAPAHLSAAMHIYQNNFKPSEFLDKPYSMACVNAIAADTDEEATHLSTSVYQLFIGIITNNRRPLQPPVDSLDYLWNEPVKAAVEQMTACSFIGSKNTIRKELSSFIQELNLNEVMISGNVFDADARNKSYSLIKEAMEE
ncbi:hypothetical protein A9P82_05185 [Arachidicoccus ginsenosidimutans]|uniref:LLM class flavin-dependent oxidoreductase n=1 Tax=Arachidicoccus sp. BS20 TaxID=1850526 RepID=UPI0007F0C969|nr:LLM class flavin-dependent oxidoreductase [Arachidicoccus sp. BS20]ANI88729.1 hypothetical protein A9P82_05185 [Arachidicoccus sp. BS20]